VVDGSFIKAAKLCQNRIVVHAHAERLESLNGMSFASANQRRAPRLPPGLRVYAVGDIHGRDDLLAKLLEMIEEDHARRGECRLLPVFLGDYVDRGPGSRAVIECLAALNARWPDTRFLRGNHEDLLLGFLGEHERGLAWLMNGGVATLASYGVRTDDAWRIFMPGHRGLGRLRAAFIRALPEAHLAFLRDLESAVQIGDYYFVHAGVRPGIPLAEQADEDRLWIRREFLSSREDFGAFVVHGHTPALRPDIRPNRIGIDTLAWETGRLTALGLEGSERWFLNTGAAFS
jgi:serine/threonine protein phosphatase 1